MLPIIVIGIIAYVAWHVYFSEDKLPDRIAEVLNTNIDVLAHQAKKPTPTERALSMELEFGQPWSEFYPEQEQSDFKFPSVYGRAERRYFGPMDMNIAGDHVLIYDMWHSFRHTSNATAISQTVISIKPPALNLPQFKIRPKFTYGIQPSTTNIKTGTVLDVQFEVDTMTPHRTKAIFQSKLGSEVLIPFLSENKWTVEWADDRFLVYEANRLIEPNRIAEFALEVSEFFDLLKSAPEAIDGMMAEMIEASKSSPR
jgi:hypothetical protein